MKREAKQGGETHAQRNARAHTRVNLEARDADRGDLRRAATAAPLLARRESMRCAALLAFASLACFVFVRSLAAPAPGGAAPAVENLSMEIQSRDDSGVDFSKFSHASQRHAALACASCHTRAADNSTQPRLPGHKSCTACHLAQFVTPNIPMCAICHTSVEGQNPPVKDFPRLRSFNAKFDHAQHNTGAARPESGCVACHAPAARRGAALSIPAGLAAHAECYTCHTPGAQANGRDISSCGVCHTLSARYYHTSADARAFRFSFSHATHGPRQRLGCADCHQLRAGLAQSQQVTAPRLLQHTPTRTQSCLTCHNGRRSFGDADFGDCRLCHRGQTFRVGG